MHCDVECMTNVLFIDIQTYSSSVQVSILLQPTMEYCVAYLTLILSPDPLTSCMYSVIAFACSESCCSDCDNSVWKKT